MNFDALLSIMPMMGLSALLGLLLFTAGLGLIALLSPPLFHRLREWGDRSVTLSISRTPFRSGPPPTLDRYFYRHHKAYGVTVLLLAAVLLSWLAFNGVVERWQVLVPPSWEPLGSVLIEAGVVFFWVLGLVSLVVGTVMLVRPSALKGIESWSNRWVELDAFSRGLNHEFPAVNRFLARHPRPWGALVLVGSLTAVLLLLEHSAVVLGWQ